MAYSSQINAIWTKISTEGSVRRPTTSRTSFDNVVAVFMQAEKCRFSDLSTSEVDTFRAEYNVWAYYFGEDVAFPGLDPATGQRATTTTALVQPHQNTSAEEATRMRQQIEGLWVGRWSRQGYQPQLGWNPATGEPWMAVRAYAENSYPALSGDHHSFLKALQDMLREFVIQYERFPHLGYTLIWPEFVAPSNLKNQGAWKRFSDLRGFLDEWSSITGKAPHINEAYEKYMARADDERSYLPLPAGFVLKFSHSGNRDLEQGRLTPPVPSRRSSTVHRRRRVLQSEDITPGRFRSRDDNWRREAKSRSASRDRGGRRERSRSPARDRQHSRRVKRESRW